MKFIKKSSIDNVIEYASAVDVVGHYEKLDKKGANLFCKSPFSEDKTASLSVSPSKNIWKCFSSGFGGTAVTFVMKKTNCSFPEAIKAIAEICNITLEYEERSEDQARMDNELDTLKKVMQFAFEKYQKAFNALTPNHWVKKMISERAYNDDVMTQFFIGYAPDSKDYITSPLINNGNFENAKSVGVTTTKDNSSYDTFRDRWIFPILNHRGEVVGFGGRRSENEDVKKYAKYINSKESKIYNKSRILYGYFQAKRSIEVAGYAVLTEGYTDVISCHQAGVTNTVASCGTALTEDQVKLLSRSCKHVVIFRDGDAAGTKAVIRDMDILLRFGFKVEVVIAEDGEDPDSLSRSTDLLAYINTKKQDAISWKAKELLNASRLEDREQIVEDLNVTANIEIGKLYDSLAADSAIKEATPTEKKILKAQNEDVHSEIKKIKKKLEADIKEIPEYDATKISSAIEDIANTLSVISNTIVLKEYTKTCSQILKQPLKLIESIVKEKQEEFLKKIKDEKDAAEGEKLQIHNLPKGADLDQYLKDRFCEVGEVYHFQAKSGDFFPGTNHVVTPLFHIEGNQDNKRLCEVRNVYGHKRLIDFESTDIINFTKFKERLIREGNFFWEPGATNEHFLLVSRKLTNEFIAASEMKILGQQKEGFYAFADGVYHNSEFKKVNKYGIVQVEGLEKNASEYKSDVTHFYSPSHSEIYKSAREDDDPYENDRYFVYKESPVRLDQWFNQLVKVFGDKGKLGVAFLLAANFRDVFLLHWKFFPLMGGIGQRDSGKSGFGNCIQSFFYTNLPALELNTSTMIAMSRRLSRVKNSVVFFDEYRDDIDEDKHQNLKGAWNSIGREKGKGADTNRTTTDKINSAVYYAGQYLPTKDDGALPSRTIILNFGQEERTIEQKEEYNKMMNWNKSGISSFVLDVIKHRSFFTTNVVSAYKESLFALKDALKGTEYQNRVFDNYLILLTTVKLLEDKIQMPFTYNEFFALTKQSIIDNSDSISDSDGLAKFWDAIRYLNEPKQSVIIENVDYCIERAPSVEIVVKKEKQTWKNTNHDQILYLRFAKVHTDYHQHASKLKGEEIIGKTTITNYLKTKNYFIGLVAAKRIDKDGSATSCYAFNYTEMLRLNVLNLRTSDDGQLSLDPADDLDTPF